MKKVIYSLLIIFAIIILSSGIQKSAGPPGCHAGEPPNNLSCTSCHSDYAVNTGSADILFDVDGADTGYIPGQTYNITISVKKPGMSAAGFQFIALQDNDLNTSPGSVTLTQPTRTQKVDAGNPHLEGCQLMQKVWVEHTYQGHISSAPGENTWSFKWKAPDNYVGNITFHLAALESDYNGDESGDYVYTRKITSNGLATSIEQVNASFNDLHIFPNPAFSKLHVKTGLYAIQKIELLNIQGMVIKQFGNLTQSENTELTLDLTGISSGIYFVSIQGKEANAVRKIVIQR